MYNLRILIAEHASTSSSGVHFFKIMDREWAWLHAQPVITSPIFNSSRMGLNAGATLAFVSARLFDAEYLEEFDTVP